MLTYHNNSSTVVVVLHEIYGVNEHMRQVCERLSGTGYDVVCPDLLSIAQPYGYEHEDMAYKNFMNLGFTQMANNARAILVQLRNTYRTVFVIGYSVGATVAWLCGTESGLVDALVCYYGSRIRDYLDRDPQCPSLLLFPVQEASFNVDELMANLRERVTVDVRKYEGLHGFADSYNTNYVESVSNQAFVDTIRFLSNVNLDC